MPAYLKRLDSKINELWSQYTILIVQKKKKNKTSNEKIEQKKRKRQQESVLSKEIKIEVLLCCIYFMGRNTNHRFYFIETLFY